MMAAASIRPPAPVRTPREAKEQIRLYAKLVDAQPELRKVISYTKHWYAVSHDNGWMFGPSKFVGYLVANGQDYAKFAQATGGLHGNETQKTLTKWAVRAQGKLKTELDRALNAFISRLGQNRRGGGGDTIWIFQDELERASTVKRTGDARFSDHISIDADICHGRPRIAGTRIRVSDIIDMFASGVSKDDILADFPSLTDEGILAALAYAADSVDHRVIRAA